MPRFVLITAYVAWPAGVFLVRLRTPVRLRCLLVAAGLVGLAGLLWG